MRADLGGLLGKDVGMFQRKQGTFGVEHADVVGRSQLVHFLYEGGGPHQVAQAHTRQPKLGQGADQQHMGIGLRIGPDVVQPAAAGKRLVGLIHDDQPAERRGRLDQPSDHSCIPEVGRRVVGIGDVGDGGLVFVHRGQHGGLVQLEVGCQRDTVKSQPLQLRAHGVHHKPGQRRQDGRAGHIATHGDQGNQLVGPIADHQPAAFGQVDVGGQRLLQVVDAGARIPVDRHRTQARTQLRLQSGWQGERVLHGIELDHAHRVLDGVSVHGLDVLADEAHGALGHGCSPRMGGTS